MSDSVRFGTANDTSTPANSSGFCGFPLPLVYEDPDLGSPFLIPTFTIQEALKYFWRVKKWTVTGTTPWGAFSQEAEVRVAKLSGSVIPTGELELLTEVLSTDYVSVVLNGQDIPTDGLAIIIIIDIFLTLDDFGDPLGYFKDNIFYLPFYIDFTFQQRVGGSTVDERIISRSDSSGNDATFDGHTFYTSTGDVTDIAIDPSEYWPYAVQPLLPDGSPHPNAGDPIYNTTTGAQLLDPVTGL